MPTMMSTASSNRDQSETDVAAFVACVGEDMYKRLRWDPAKETPVAMQYMYARTPTQARYLQHFLVPTTTDTVA
jgi:hypothetical protein